MSKDKKKSVTIIITCGPGDCDPCDIWRGDAVLEKDKYGYWQCPDGTDIVSYLDSLDVWDVEDIFGCEIEPGAKLSLKVLR